MTQELFNEITRKRKEALEDALKRGWRPKVVWMPDGMRELLESSPELVKRITGDDRDPER